jgi:hypothetical protein
VSPWQTVAGDPRGTQRSQRLTGVDGLDKSKVLASEYRILYAQTKGKGGPLLQPGDASKEDGSWYPIGARGFVVQSYEVDVLDTEHLVLEFEKFNEEQEKHGLKVIAVYKIHQYVDPDTYQEIHT